MSTSTTPDTLLSSLPVAYNADTYCYGSTTSHEVTIDGTPLTFTFELHSEKGSRLVKIDCYIWDGADNNWHAYNISPNVSVATMFRAAERS